MKNVFYLLLTVCILFVSCTHYTKKTDDKGNLPVAQVAAYDSLDVTNYFYDNAETNALKTGDIMIQGEIGNPAKVDFSKLSKHTLIVKETQLDETGNKFIGAYRYDGYSLMDILNNTELKKINAEKFPPIIDLYVIIENDKGDSVVVSWGEIFYPNNLHNIIIATDVMRIVPSKTKDLWPLPEDYKLVINTDLITERNISRPSKITVKSYNGDFEISKGMSPMMSPEIKLFANGELMKVIDENPKDLQIMTYNAIFYGKGRGIHSTQPFKGIMLKSLYEKYATINSENLKKGIFLIKALDGYNSVFTYSEIFNRIDQSEVLVIYDKDAENNGKFRIYPACDFFSDRAVKAIDEIYFEKIK